MSNLPETGKRRFFFYLRIVTVLLWTAGLVFLSLTPNAVGFSLPNTDKILHLGAYMLTAWLVARSFHLFSFSVIKSSLFSLFYAIFLGALLEFLQVTFTQNRTAEAADMVANTLGALLGCAIFCLQAKLLSRNHET